MKKPKEIKPSDILKWLMGTKEGRAYYREELKQFHRDVVAAAEKHFFGDDGGELDEGTRVQSNNKDI